MFSKTASGNDGVNVCSVNGRPGFPYVGCEVGIGKCSSWPVRDINGDSTRWDMIL